MGVLFGKVVVFASVLHSHVTAVSLQSEQVDHETETQTYEDEDKDETEVSREETDAPQREEEAQPRSGRISFSSLATSAAQLNRVYKSSRQHRQDETWLADIVENENKNIFKSTFNHFCRIVYMVVWTFAYMLAVPFSFMHNYDNEQYEYLVLLIIIILSWVFRCYDVEDCKPFWSNHMQPPPEENLND
eukprot:gene902-406_t